MSDDRKLPTMYWAKGPFGAGPVLTTPTHPPRELAEIKRLIEVYPPQSRRWCKGIESGGCGCVGCVRWPAVGTVRGDPEGKAFPNPDDMLTEEEVAIYRASVEN